MEYGQHRRYSLKKFKIRLTACRDKKIREKIEFDTSNPQYIETVWGVGYRFRM